MEPNNATPSTTDPNYIPSVGDVVAIGGGQSWRPANGKIVRGQEIKERVSTSQGIKEMETGNYPEELTVVLGRLRRIGIYERDHEKYGKQYKFDMDLETAEGMMFISCNLLDTSGNIKPSVSAINLAWAATQYSKDELVYLQTKLGEPVDLGGGKMGGKPTYINPFRVEGTNCVPIMKPKRDPNAARVELADQWFALVPALKAHPAFADRPSSRTDEEGTGAATTHLSALVKECQEKGWPTPENATADWLQLMSTALKTPVYAKLSDYHDDQWGEARRAMQNVTNVPPMLQIAANRLAAAKGIPGQSPESQSGFDMGAIS